MKIEDNDQRNENLSFHYSRDRRLEHAPEEVQRVYLEGNTAKAGFFHGLTANSGLRSVFFSIILLSAAIVFIAFFGGSSGTTTLEGLKVNLKAFLYGETVYITITCRAEDEKVELSSPVNALVSGLDPDGLVIFNKELSGVYRNEVLILRTLMPDYEVKTVTASLKINKKDAILSVTVDRK